MKTVRRGIFCRPASVVLVSRRLAGFTLFELLGIILLVSVLSLVLYDRFLGYQALAEKTAMEMTVINMRSGLRLRVAELMMGGKMDEIAGLVHENPINWLAAPPPNYIGALQNPEQSAIPGNAWYFDTSRHELIYMPGSGNIFATQPRASVVRFRVAATIHPPVKGGSKIPKVEGVTLVRVP
ncbi:hypothetical protein [Sulfuriferula multivorans]|uniref:hypothetical protein n=1 Tax=Sulfuriferula multivorans TaxID=1559896 RepID=UPI000F5BCE8D|nr:hypothetical protein [Sulfuriferula multivorans]